MKRLVDETTDELARSLLEAGIEHRPPPGNKARVIVAIGAGGALGMFSSNAFAWLSTTAGKVTAVGVAVGVAGAVWVAVPPAGEARSGAEASSGANVTAQLRASSPSTEADSRVAGSRAAGNRAVGSTASGDEAAIGAGAVAPGAVSDGAVSDGAELAEAESAEAMAAARPGAPERSPEADTSSGVSAGRDSTASSERPRSSRRERARKASARRGVAQEKVVASKLGEPRRDAPPSAAQMPSAGGAHEAPSAEQAALDTEVRLVDDMHSAARRNDREALGRFLERYRSTFPDGQLKHEVAEFAARLDRPDTSIAR